MSTTPTLGRIVHSKLTSEDAAAINRRRIEGAGHSENWPAGAQAHVGSHAFQGQDVVAMIVAVWPNEFGEGIFGVNLQCLLDGTDSYWTTSKKEGTLPGEWTWPSRV